MTTRVEQRFYIDAPPEAVMKAMANPALIDTSETSRGSRNVRVADRRKTDAVHEYEIRVLVPAKSVTGVDHSKMEENSTIVTWDVPKCCAKWSWTGPHGPKISISGTHTITPSGSGSNLVLAVSIDVGIPVVGKMIEKKVREGFETAWVSYTQLVGKFANGRMP